jgi:hypothetical protein
MAPKLRGIPPLHGLVVRLTATLKKMHNKTAGTTKPMDPTQRWTPLLCNMARQPKAGWAIPPNPYKIPWHAIQLHRASVHPLVQTVDTGMDDEVLQPPPPPAPDKKVSKKLSVSLLHDDSQFNQEELVKKSNIGGKQYLDYL